MREGQWPHAVTEIGHCPSLMPCATAQTLVIQTTLRYNPKLAALASVANEKTSESAHQVQQRGLYSRRCDQGMLHWKQMRAIDLHHPTLRDAAAEI